MRALLMLAMLAQAVPGGTSFRSRSELVVLHVSVMDRHTGFVADLSRDAFTVYDDGRRQPIAFFESEDTPATVGLIIDSSGSMLRRRDAVVAAGMAFAEASRPDDELFAIHFNEHVWRGLPPGQLFTSEHAELYQALDHALARGQTALFDAIHAGLIQLDRAGETRRVLIVISDGGDNASRTSFDQVLDEALRRDVVIYCIGLYDRIDTDAKPGVLRALAEATGGETFLPDRIDEVRPDLEHIARDIRSSYTLGYVPPADGADRRRHEVHVKVRPPDHRKLEVRARSAYVGDEPAKEDGGA
jgi:Ca-activated chloride channel family protein